MRFKAKLVNITCIHHFTRVIATVSHMTKSCALRLTPAKIYFILNDSAAQGGVTVWCELNQGNLFEEFRLEGKDQENNIYLELNPENLAKAMKSAQNAQTVKIKLTKKHTACLTFEIILPSLVSHTRTVTHDTPVSVIPEEQWCDYQEPNMPDCDVSICMPPLKTVRNIVDKMKCLSNFLIISANNNGYMTLKVDTDMVSVKSHFRDLEVCDLEQSSRSCSPDEMSETTVDIKKFITFLHGHQVSPSKVICNIVNQRAVHFFLIHEDFSLQYFIPALVI